jgi:hypothetical protein
MPLLPTRWFITRNVEISGQWSDADMEYHASQISAHASFGWGPWSAQGNYRESTSEKTATSHFQGTTLVIPQPQILAVFGNLLNVMPHPDPSLPWGADADLNPPTYPLLEKELAASRRWKLAQARRRLDLIDGMKRLHELVSERHDRIEPEEESSEEPFVAA